MNSGEILLIDKKDGFGATFSHLVSMMDYTRFTTLRAVEGLTIKELDYRLHDEANSIGMLLGHMGAVERWYQIFTFEKREPNEIEEKEIGPGISLGEDARVRYSGKPLEFYLDSLAEIRRDTYAMFQILPDEWLLDKAPFWGGDPANNYFKWFHVLEDELSHRGQVRLIKKYSRIGVAGK